MLSARSKNQGMSKRVRKSLRRSELIILEEEREILRKAPRFHAEKTYRDK